MPRRSISIQEYTCAQCGYVWLPRRVDREPHKCPKCQSVLWDEEASTPGRASRAEPATAIVSPTVSDNVPSTPDDTTHRIVSPEPKFRTGEEVRADLARTNPRWEKFDERKRNALVKEVLAQEARDFKRRQRIRDRAAGDLPPLEDDDQEEFDTDDGV